MNDNDNYATLTHTETARNHTALLHGELSNRIIAAFYAVYNRLGFGFLESVYKNALANEFKRRGIPFEREVTIDVFDLGELVGHFRSDFLADGKIILEVKAANAVGEPDRQQALNYLKGTRLELALVLNFGPKPTIQRLLLTNDRKP